MINVRRICVAYILYKRRNKKTRVHVDPFLENRLLAGAFVTHFGKLQNSERKFKNYFRMSIRSFDELLCKIENKLQKSSLRRITIQPIERLAITLRYLATGNTFTDLHYSYVIGIATISEIVTQVCYIIWIELKSECIPQLNGIKWKEIAEGFLTYTNFPNCLGAIDGKHIRVIRPPHSGSLYFNYKKYYSVVLLAMCDADYNFTYINVGTSGSNADSTIFRRSHLYTKLESNTLGIPDPQELPIICPEVAYPSSVRAKLPFVIVGDEAFGLSSHVMRPYARDNLPYRKKIFNYRLSRARRYIECTFGIMSNKFRIFHRSMTVKLDLAQLIVKTACVLHNFIRKRDGYMVSHTFVTNGFTGPLPRQQTESSNTSASNIRDIFADYFINEGKVSWQHRYIIN
ncbi:uncharacterized protein LOC126965301 [Leptidea sinapis]|uniref:uncharacterized protein LOC126965301 n=1 Tax=Leptidea sinapis TaxID=189913 RepID=UPI0021C2B366|nr:uncharacterized protein LOC126965301 [Leptidea sinapis]